MPVEPQYYADIVWPDIQSKLILPPGMTKSEAFAKHSMPNLLKHFDHKTCPVQLVPHCGIPNYANGIPDGCMSALWNATAGEEKEEGNLVELDPLWINGQPYVIHKLLGDQHALIEGHWSNWKLPTNLLVTPLQECIQDLVLRNQAMTIFLDCQNEDAAKLVTITSNYWAYHPNVIIQIHPYVFRDGAEFVDMVDELNPSLGWKSTVAIVPTLNPDTLPILAHVPHHSLDFGALYSAGQAWIISMINAEMRIYGLGFPLSGIGHGVNVDTGETHDLDHNLVTNPHIKAKFLWDCVLLDLMAWAKKTYPTLVIIMMSLTYTYSYDNTHYTTSFQKGRPSAWPKGAESHGRELMAVPGNPLQHGADIVICDRMMDNLNAVLGTKIYTWPADVDYATHNVRMDFKKQGEEEQGAASS